MVEEERCAQNIHITLGTNKNCRISWPVERDCTYLNRLLQFWTTMHYCSFFLPVPRPLSLSLTLFSLKFVDMSVHVHICKNQYICLVYICICLNTVAVPIFQHVKFFKLPIVRCRNSDELFVESQYGQIFL